MVEMRFQYGLTPESVLLTSRLNLHPCKHLKSFFFTASIILESVFKYNKFPQTFEARTYIYGLEVGFDSSYMQFYVTANYKQGPSLNTLDTEFPGKN